MNLNRLKRQRQQAWDDLGSLIARAGTRPDRLGAGGVRRLGALYRAATADLARLRQHHPNDPATARLEAMVVSARQLVYDAPGRRSGFGAALFFGYWRAIRERPAQLMVAAACLLVPATGAWIWSLLDPVAAAGLVPEQFVGVLTPGPGGTDTGMTIGEQAAFSSFLITNNIRVSLLAFAAGIAFGLGGAYVLASNGLVLGAVGGLLVDGGNGRFFVELVAAHGLLELSLVVVAGAAGIRMGWAIVDPGRRRRTDALTVEARRAIVVAFGSMPWFVVAGIIEGFVSRRGLTAPVVAVVGVVIGGLYWVLVLWLGRPAPGRAEPDQMRASRLASR